MRRASLGFAILIIGVLSAHGQTAKKASAVGIMCLLRGDSFERPFQDLAHDPCWSNPNVQGVSLRSNWSKIEPVEGQFDWAFFDEGVRLAARAHKKIAMCVVAGVTTPSWVYNSGAYRFNIHKLRRQGYAEAMSQPVPWDQTFLSKWGNFIRAFASRYDNVEDLAYVVMGGSGRRAETFFVDSPEDIARVESNGDLSRWVQGSEKIADLYSVAFLKTPFIMALGPPVPDDAGKRALKQLVDYAAGNHPGHFGMMSAGLRPRYDMSSIGAQLIHAWSGRTPVGFQMLLPSKAGRLMSEGTLEDALNRGIAIGGHFFEVYSVDCQDPNQGPVLQRAAAKLFARYGGE
jgi:hypothetical protein